MTTHLRAPRWSQCHSRNQKKRSRRKEEENKRKTTPCHEQICITTAEPSSAIPSLKISTRTSRQHKTLLNAVLKSDCQNHTVIVQTPSPSADPTPLEHVLRKLSLTAGFVGPTYLASRSGTCPTRRAALTLPTKATAPAHVSFSVPVWRTCCTVVRGTT